MSENPSADLEIKRAAQLSLVEISLGSLGHGFKIPLAGQILSLNQLAFLLNANNKDRLPTSSSFEISSIAAVLKSFSPAGEKLGPMFSIAMQGFLFWIFNSLFRKHLLGQILGAVVLSFWSFVQPVITFFLIYGYQLVKLYDYYEKKLAQEFSFVHSSILVAVTIVLLIKMILSVVMVFYSVATQKEIRFVSVDQMQKLSKGRVDLKRSASPWKAALRDMTRPLFILSFLLMIIFIWQIEGPMSQKIWLGLRPLATAYLIFYLVRSPYIAEKLFQLSRRSESFNKIYQKAKKAYEMLSSKET